MIHTINSHLSLSPPFPTPQLKHSQAASLLLPSPPLRSASPISPIIEWISAQRTSTLVTAREPLEEAAGMKQVFARLAALLRHLLV